MNTIIKRGCAGLLLTLLLVAGGGVVLPIGGHGLAAAAGLEQRALFQGRVDYTLTTHDRENFQEQDLENTSFAGAHARGADFSDALLDLSAARQLCAMAEGTNPQTGVSTRDSLASYC